MNRKQARKEIYNWIADKMIMEVTNTDGLNDEELQIYSDEQAKIAVEMRRRANKIKTH